MIIFILGILGLMFGSFVNALVWRIYEQTKVKKSKKLSKKHKDLTSRELSITKGRSMCPDCHHTLSAWDLVPVLSWVYLRGKCRYCHKKISWQYPLVEVITSSLFIISYIWWPAQFTTYQYINFAVWCVLIVGLMALLVYDVRWMLLPDKIVFPLAGLTGVFALYTILTSNSGTLHMAEDYALSLVVASGLFWILYEYSKGKWIGGGDVKLGLIIGLTIGVPLQAFLVLFFASLIGTIVIVPGLVSKKLKATSRVPFGPFLIVATIIVKLFGASIVAWYRKKYLLY